MKKWVLRGFAALFILIFFYFLLACGKKKEATKLVAVTRGDIQEKALAVGTIEPERETKVKSTIPGIVSEVLFKVGDAVKAGAPLFKISPNPTPLEYVEARRSMELAEVTMKKLKADWERQMEMFKKSLISQSDMEAVESTFQEANLRYKIAADRLELLEKGRISISNVEINSIIKAPATGIILSQNVFQGDPVVPLTNYQPGTELCSLADMDSLRFKGTVDEIDVGKLVTGMDVEIQIGALPETKIAGRVTRIYPKAKKEGNATLFDIEISLNNTSGMTLRAGFSATASIRIRERKQVLILPERLVIFENGKRFVEIPENAGGEAEKTKKIEIQTGLSDGLNIEILSGVKEGDKIVERPPREIK
ncbi:MAG: efflux RND transporter periplasmic adaptor subunit [Candidatus Aminicenantes bacterium]|nr:efflux RND transporter periplasmic adaptor subunit [Candidatus Aminicenantes bacterium]